MKFAILIFTCGVLFLFSTHTFAADQKPADLYKAKCKSCHGVDGKATAVGKKLGARDFSDPDVKGMSEADLEKVTSAGKHKMPAYKGKLTDAQIKALVSYVRALQ